MALGQKINREKTTMVFSKIVPTMKQEEILSFWGIQEFQHYNKYLGLPPIIGRARYKAFSNIKHKV